MASQLPGPHPMPLVRLNRKGRSEMTDRAADIVSPTTDRPLPDKTTAADARAQGRFGHDKPTVDNSIVLLIDHQIGLMVSTRDTSTVVELRSNVLGLARTAKALQLPTLISASNAQWQNGDTVPELKELFPDTAIIRRTGIINAYEGPAFRAAFDAIVEQTGRRHVIIAGVTIGTCCTFPTLFASQRRVPSVPRHRRLRRLEQIRDRCRRRPHDTSRHGASDNILPCLRDAGRLEARDRQRHAGSVLPEPSGVRVRGAKLLEQRGGHAVADPFATVT